MVELVEALKALEIGGSVCLRYISKSRIAVHINGEYFGIWDEARKTFVD